MGRALLKRVRFALIHHFKLPHPTNFRVYLFLHLQLQFTHIMPSVRLKLLFIITIIDQYQEKC